MLVGLDESTDLQVRTRLGERGARLTATRRAVLYALLERPGPSPVAELDGDLPDIPLSSLYRSLSVLTEAGIIVSLPGGEGVSLYEPAEWLSGHHHHFVCRVCGTVQDVDVDVDVEEALERVSASAARRGFRVEDHRLALEGRCAGCVDA